MNGDYSSLQCEYLNGRDLSLSAAEQRRWTIIMIKSSSDRGQTRRLSLRVLSRMWHVMTQPLALAVRLAELKPE